MIKKGYVRTEIIKFLNKLEKDLKRPLIVDDVFRNASVLYSNLQNDPENPLGNCPYNIFLDEMQLGYAIARSNEVMFI